MATKNLTNPRPLRQSLEERFWSKVDKSAGPDGCWVWTAGRFTFGYGALVDDNNNALPTHRISWILHFGEIPRDMFVCHRCDNAPCVNPTHLFLGTQADNMADRARKKRHVWGETHHKAKLTEAQVLSVADLKKSGMTRRQIAASFGVSIATVADILQKRSWPHLWR